MFGHLIHPKRSLSWGGTLHFVESVCMLLRDDEPLLAGWGSSVVLTFPPHDAHPYHLCKMKAGGDASPLFNIRAGYSGVVGYEQPYLPALQCEVGAFGGFGFRRHFQISLPSLEIRMALDGCACSFDLNARLSWAAFHRTSEAFWLAG